MFDLELLSSARTKSVISSLQLCSLFFFLAHMSQLRCSREEFHDHYRYAVSFRPFGLVNIHRHDNKYELRYHHTMSQSKVSRPKYLHWRKLCVVYNLHY